MAGKRDTTAIAAWVTAIAAVIVAVWQGYETRVHQRISVRPQLVFYRNFEISEHPKKPLGVQMENQGLGPARIRPVHLYIDGEWAGVGKRDGWNEAIMKLGLSGLGTRYFWIEGEAVWRAGVKRELVFLPIANATKEKLGKLRKALDRTGFVVCYCSFYEECTYSHTGLLPENVADVCTMRVQKSVLPRSRGHQSAPPRDK